MAIPPQLIAGAYPRGAFAFAEGDAIDPTLGDCAVTTVTAATALDIEDGVLDRQPMRVCVIQGSGGSKAWTLSSAFEVPAAVTMTLSTDAGVEDHLGLEWSESKGKWVVLAFVPGAL